MYKLYLVVGTMVVSIVRFTIRIARNDTVQASYDTNRTKNRFRSRIATVSCESEDESENHFVSYNKLEFENPNFKILPREPLLHSPPTATTIRLVTVGGAAPDNNSNNFVELCNC